jgi:hypothetical protein
MQVTFRQQMRYGVSFNGFYTWSKTMEGLGFDGGGIQDQNNLKLEKGPTNTDQRHMFVTSVVWRPDYVKNSRYVGNVVNGWSISPIIKIYSGSPFTVTTGADNNNDGTSPDRANQIGIPYGATISHSNRSSEVYRWFDPSAFCAYSVANPNACYGVGPAGSDGTTQRNGYYGPGSKDVDLAILRDFRIEQRMIFQLRGEATNVFNFVNPNNPNGAINISGTANQITGASSMRQIQVGGRFTF